MPSLTLNSCHRFAARALLSVVCTLSATACAAEFVNVTSGEIGCPREEITVSDRHTGWNSGSWTAECRGRIYYCSGTAGSIDCQPATEEGIGHEQQALEQTSGGSPGATPETSGCLYDTQCKGDRVCTQGSCVAPASSPDAISARESKPRR